MYNHFVNNRLVCIICLMWGFIAGSVSGMNRIKTAQKNSMSEVVLQDLMSICLAGGKINPSTNTWVCFAFITLQMHHFAPCSPGLPPVIVGQPG